MVRAVIAEQIEYMLAKFSFIIPGSSSWKEVGGWSKSFIALRSN
jgi:hypothetical protein